MDQGSIEWHEARLGKVTASRISDVMAKVKSGGEAATRASYRLQLVTERLTQKPTEMFTNAAMRWGMETEPYARSIYEAMTGGLVGLEGFVDHPTIQMAGASPDGLVGRDGLIEIKCPESRTHVEYLCSGKPPTDYVRQMQFQMACTGRDWCDFMSFDPRLPENLQVLIVRVERDQKLIAEIEEGVVEFLKTVDELEAKLRRFK